MDLQSSSEMKNFPKEIQPKIMDSQSSSEIPLKSEITQVHTATKMKRKSISNQEINAILSHDYVYQKTYLANVRLQEAGFQSRNYTPEDGNCFIHALKDQMRYCVLTE